MHKYESKCIKFDRAQRVAIVGARGYSGLDLARLLLKHPNARLEACMAGERGFDLADYLPENVAREISVLSIDELDKVASNVGTVFLATPAEVSMELAPRILQAGASAIDLSGAFRLSETGARQWYGISDVAAGLLQKAEFGLVPWVGPSQGGAPRLISNPGCYATAVLMALLPLLKEKQIRAESLVIDAKSGATGAGRKPAENLLFCEVEGECLPYKVGSHQHLPEIQKYASVFAQTEIDPIFVTHLLPVRRGIIAGLYARVSPGVTLESIEKAYADAYEGYALARFGRLDPSKRQLLSLKRISGSARTEIRFELKGDQLYVFSLIDNLMKGAASQAIENFNRLNDLPVTTGLMEIEGQL